MEEKQIPILFNSNMVNHYDVEIELTAKVSTWLNTRVEVINEAWSQPSKEQQMSCSNRESEIADEIIKILTHRVFNYQSKINLREILFNVRQNLLKQIKKGSTINFFLLYNGGYRASAFQSQPSLIFEPDQTELMLLYQISLLKNKILTVYNPGIEFFIVINNGVAKWVNDIPILDTENYANKLTRLIRFFGAEAGIKVLLQSNFEDFCPDFSFGLFESKSIKSFNDHAMVERFLGRRCSRDEAEYRLALYTLAESKWATDLLAKINTHDGIVMRQIAHPGMLSFRPFPGGATRIQNGTFGFQFQANSLMPKLITSKSTKENATIWIPYPFSFEERKTTKSLN